MTIGPQAQFYNHILAVRAFAAVVVFASVVLLFQQNNVDSEHAITGIVTGVAPETITVVNDTTDPTGVVLSLHDDLRADGAYPAKIEAGSEVTVWYRRGGDRWPVARKIVVVRAQR